MKSAGMKRPPIRVNWRERAVEKLIAAHQLLAGEPDLKDANKARLYIEEARTAATKVVNQLRHEKRNEERMENFFPLSPSVQ